MLLAVAFLALSDRTVVDLDGSWEYARVPSVQDFKSQALGRQGPDWASQYNIERVQTGDARFDLGAADLDRLRIVELSQITTWQPATLPHAAWIRPLNSPAIWQGVVYYRRHVPGPPPGRREVLVLQGMQGVDVWLNGRQVAERRGGYLPLRAEMRAGGDLLVRVDNSDNPLIPPGKPQHELDFMYGCGLIANATLEVTDSLHLTDALDQEGGAWVEPPTLRSEGASIRIHAPAQNDGTAARAFELRQVILDPSGHPLKLLPLPCWLPGESSSEFTQSVTLSNPHLWSPDSPSLYSLRNEIVANGVVVDAKTMRFGLRTIQVSRAKGFVLNGKPRHLIGTNRHQDYPWVGPALSDTANRRDALMIKRAGHNIVRLSHYNQSPAFLDACDELGIMVIPCIPGWQFINRDRRFTDRVLRDIRQTVHRDRNHPCVAWWEASLNETYPPAEMAKAWHAAARGAGATLTAGDDGKDVPWEVVYNGWREDLSRPSRPDRPGYIREYGDYEFGGATSTSRVRIGQGIDKLLNETWNHVWSLNKFRPQYPSTMGEGTWEMFDHNVPWDFAVSASGLADIMRREKPSFWFFASQSSPTPYLKIAADWQPGPASRRIVVFTNAPSVSLYVNGRLLRTALPPRGPETKYALDRAFDGTNTTNLAHPPVVFDNFPYLAGELKAVGTNAAADAIRTAGPPTRLNVWLDDLGVKAETNDLVFVRAAIVDANGVVCPAESRMVQFAGAPFAGENQAPCEMGVASVLVRTPLTPGAMEVRATAGPLSGSCRFRFGLR